MKNTAFTSLITLSLVGVLTAGAALTSFAEENDTSAYFDLEIDAHRGEQPLYPVVFAIE